MNDSIVYRRNILSNVLNHTESLLQSSHAEETFVLSYQHKLNEHCKMTTSQIFLHKKIN